MYHYSNNHMQNLYQNQYPHCSYINSNQIQVNSLHNNSYSVSHTALPENPCISQSEGVATPSLSITQAAIKVRNKKKSVRGFVDTSNFTIEERLVAAVWVHERKRMRINIGQIKRDFRERFEREPPAKNTLLSWEKKLFASGNVCDAPRPGRPVKRAALAAAASVARAPALSLRARAAALRVPRSTLRAVLRRARSPPPRAATGKPKRQRAPAPAPQPHV